jgi:hypothetical protein
MSMLHCFVSISDPPYITWHLLDQHVRMIHPVCVVCARNMACLYTTGCQHAVIQLGETSHISAQKDQPSFWWAGTLASWLINCFTTKIKTSVTLQSFSLILFPFLSSFQAISSSLEFHITYSLLFYLLFKQSAVHHNFTSHIHCWLILRSFTVSVQWKRLPTSNEPPPPRAYHSMTSIGSRFLLFGGFDGKNTFGDLWWLVPEGIVISCLSD